MNNWEFDFTTSRGLNHIEWGTICEDSVKVCQKNGCILAALSDGVGSTESPEVASLTAVDETLGFLEEFSQDPLRLETLAKNTAFTDNNEYLFKQNLMQKIHAAMQDHPSSDATLVFLLAAPEYGVALTGWLGDSAVCVLKRDGSSVLYTQRRRRGGATESVGMENAEDYLELAILDLNDGIAGVLLTSDGMEDIIYQKNDLTALKETERFANALFHHDTKLVEQLLREVQEEGRTADDISLAAVMCEEVSLTEDPRWRCSCGKYNILDDISCPACGTQRFLLYSGARDRIKDVFNNSSTEFFRYLNAHPNEEAAYLRSKGAAFLASEDKPEKQADVPDTPDEQPEQTESPANPEETETPETLAGREEKPSPKRADPVAHYSVYNRKNTFYNEPDDDFGYSGDVSGSDVSGGDVYISDVYSSEAYSGGVRYQNAAPNAPSFGSSAQWRREPVTDSAQVNAPVPADTKRSVVLKRTLIISGAVLSGILLTLITVKSVALFTNFFQRTGSETVPVTTVYQPIETTEVSTEAATEAATENAVTRSTSATDQTDPTAPALPSNESAVVLESSLLFSSPNSGVVIAFVDAYDVVTVQDAVYEDGELWYYVKTTEDAEGYLSADVLAAGSSAAESNTSESSESESSESESSSPKGFSVTPYIDD